MKRNDEDIRQALHDGIDQTFFSDWPQPLDAGQILERSVKPTSPRRRRAWSAIQVGAAGAAAVVLVGFGGVIAYHQGIGKRTVGGAGVVGNQTTNGTSLTTTNVDSYANAVSNNAESNTTINSNPDTTSSQNSAVFPFSATGMIQGSMGTVCAPPWLVGETSTGDSQDTFPLKISSSIQLNGVTWNLPPNTNPDTFFLMPTVVDGHAYLVWFEQPTISNATNLDWTPDGPTTLWMTPWRASGGRLDVGAEPITTVPLVWSRTGQYQFVAGTQPNSGQSLAAASISGAWTGWYHPGKGDTTTSPEGNLDNNTTTALPTLMWPAYNGIVVEITAHLKGANQGGSTNLYYINLQDKSIYGIASLLAGGGRFSDVLVGNGAVYVQQAGNINAQGDIGGSNAVFDEVQHKHVAVPFWGMTEGRPTVDMRNGVLYDKDGIVKLDLKLPASVTRGLTPDVLSK